MTNFVQLFSPGVQISCKKYDALFSRNLSIALGHFLTRGPIVFGDGLVMVLDEVKNRFGKLCPFDARFRVSRY